MTRVLILMVCLLVTSCIVQDEPHRRFDIAPVDIGDGWEIATPEEVGMDAQMLEAAYRQWWGKDAFRAGLSLLVVRNGMLVQEGYPRRASDRTQLFHIVSSTKSITSLMMGISQRLGYLQNLDTPIAMLMPEAFEEAESPKEQITLRHLLTMTSGIDYDNDYFSLEIVGHKKKSVVPFLLSKPMYAPPGRTFFYRDMDPHLVSAAIQNETGQQMETLAAQHLFAPLGITDYVWEEDEDGHTFGPFGLYLRARDMAKIGQMMLQRGHWNGVEIIEEDWFVQSTSEQVLLPDDNIDYEHRRYGYYWWRIDDVGAFASLGHGGNYIYVVPEHDLVIVQTAFPSSNYDFGAAITPVRFNPIVQKIIDSIIMDSP